MQPGCVGSVRTLTSSPMALGKSSLQFILTKEKPELTEIQTEACLGSLLPLGTTVWGKPRLHALLGGSHCEGMTPRGSSHFKDSGTDESRPDCVRLPAATLGSTASPSSCEALRVSCRLLFLLFIPLVRTAIFHARSHKLKMAFHLYCQCFLQNTNRCWVLSNRPFATYSDSVPQFCEE